MSTDAVRPPRAVGSYPTIILRRDRVLFHATDAPRPGLSSTRPDDRLLLEEAIRELADDPFIPVRVGPPAVFEPLSLCPPFP